MFYLLTCYSLRYLCCTYGVKTLLSYLILSVIKIIYHSLQATFPNPTLCCPSDRNHSKETISAKIGSNGMSVRLICTCLLCCVHCPVIDVTPWSFFTAASNILFFMRVGFHLLCASICVRYACANIDSANTSGGSSHHSLCVHYIHTHRNFNAYMTACLCVWVYLLYFIYFLQPCVFLFVSSILIIGLLLSVWPLVPSPLIALI